jgi:CRP/FNR family cyclic AMP-dependent transcriptional regulator
MPTTQSPLLRKLHGLKNISFLSSRQMDRLSVALVMTTVEKRGVIFDETDILSAHVLVAGIARITCRNRKGQRILVLLLSPGMIPGLPPPVTGISYGFRCEAVTECELGTVDLDSYVRIALGAGSELFKRVAGCYAGRWDLVQLRCANFMSCSLEERLALVLLELSESFGVPRRDGTQLTSGTRHRDLAELAGASRPRITEQLIEFERRRFISRESRRFVIRRERLLSLLSPNVRAKKFRVASRLGSP